MNRVISFSEKEMVKKRPESYLTNFLADLLLEEAKIEATTKQLNIQPIISYYNYGGIRSFLPKGEITVGKIFELMPFENEMVFLQLSGDQIQEFLNQIAKKGGDSLGGARFIISNEKAKAITINGTQLDLNEKYWLVTNDYVAEGGDGLDVFTRRLQIVKSGRKIRDVIINHLEKKQKNGETLTANLDGRINYE
jgi:2',3'-cyclic-nucleotide 2'-phosphodiesterase (5'-nucleotidase family)